MATQTQTTDSGSNPMPTWLSIPIILLCLVGGGYLIHWYVVSDPLSHEEKVLGEPAKTVSQNNPARNVGRMFTGGPGGPAQGGGQGGQGLWQDRRNQGGTAPSMRLTDPQRNQWELKTDIARVDVSYEKNKLNLRSITYNNFAFLPNDVRTKIKAARNIATNTEQAQALKLNVGQMRSLHTLAFSVNAMVVSPEDRDLLSAELTKYIQSPEATRPTQSPQLYKTLDEIAQRSTPATIKTAGDRLEEIDKIITPDMWKQYGALIAPANTPGR